MRPVHTILGALLLVGCAPEAERAPTGVLHLYDAFRSMDGTPVEHARRTLGGVGQEAVVHDPSGDVVATIVAPAGGTLRFAFAVEGPVAGATAHVLLRENGHEEHLWSADSLSARWTFHRIPLAGYAGKRMEIVLRGEGTEETRLLWGSPVVSSRGSTRRDLVLYEIDTLRADALASYGAPGSSTPAIGRLARQGVEFSECYSTASWTRPAATSILTSLAAPRHGVVGERSRLPDNVVTLADVLRERGWYTVAFQTNPHGGRPAGLDQGFDLAFEMSGLVSYVARHRDRWEGSSVSTSSASGTGELVAFALADLLPDWSDLPLFLFLHTTDPHTPYAPRWPFTDLAGFERDSLSARAVEPLWKYGQDVRAADFFVGRALRLLEKSSRLDEALFALVSDHGEEFTEHGRIGHGLNLYVETLHVPFLLWSRGGLPGQRLRRDRVSTLDVLPTVLDLLGVEAPDGIEGRRLFPGPGSADAADPFPREPQFAHVVGKGMRLDEEAAADPAVVGHLSIARGSWKYVLADYGTRRKPRAELYDLRVDPGEKNDVSTARPDLVGAMERDVRAWWESERTGVAVEEQPVDPEVEAQLRALGYVK